MPVRSRIPNKLSYVVRVTDEQAGTATFSQDFKAIGGAMNWAAERANRASAHQTFEVLYGTKESPGRSTGRKFRGVRLEPLENPCACDAIAKFSRGERVVVIANHVPALLGKTVEVVEVRSDPAYYAVSHEGLIHRWFAEDELCAVSAANPLDSNLAESSEIVPGVSGTPRVAETEICDSRQCEIAHLLVRGDYVEFVSAEQVRHFGSHPLDDRAMPSDVVLPQGYVLVHDATGTLLTPCDLYVVKWHRSGAKYAHNIAAADRRAAESYFGDDDLRVGKVDLPDGPWESVGKVKFIRYRRYGFANHFEHEYTRGVDLYQSQRPLAWRLQLPEGCVVDGRGFVVP